MSEKQKVRRIGNSQFLKNFSRKQKYHVIYILKELTVF